MDGNEFRKCREGLGLSREEAAKSFMVSKETIVNWELGRRKVPGLAIALCRLLHEKQQRLKEEKRNGTPP